MRVESLAQIDALDDALPEVAFLESKIRADHPPEHREQISQLFENIRTVIKTIYFTVDQLPNTEEQQVREYSARCNFLITGSLHFPVGLV